MRRKILAVDDDANILEMVQVILDDAGYEVRTASDGPSALAAIAGESPDLVILDVMMPGMSGFTVARKLKADPATRSIPILMLTARQGPTDMSDGLAIGVDMYLGKPFDTEELCAFVNRLVPQSDEE